MPISSHTMPIRSERSRRSAGESPAPGLVEDGEAGVGGQGPGEIDQSLFPGVHPGHRPVGEGFDAEVLEQLERVAAGQPVVVLGEGEPETTGEESAPHPAVLGHHQVLGRRHRLEQRRPGEHPGHAEPAALVGGQARHVAVAEVDPSGGRPEAGQGVAECGLAGAVGADDGHDLAVVELHVDVGAGRRRRRSGR